MITAKQIEEAKKRTAYAHRGEVHHQHDDCIRIAYEWLDAQAKTKGTTRTARALKHLIEDWAGRYVSQSDVEVAAELHPAIKGRYPYYNISEKLIRPSDSRLVAVKEAKTQNYKINDSDRTYSSKEILSGSYVTAARPPEQGASILATPPNARFS